MKKESKLLITGGNGMVGKSLISKLKNEGYTNILSPNSKELDLRDKEKVFNYFKKNIDIEYVFHLAARVGGIAENMRRPADFLYDNVQMQNNIIEAARLHSIKKLLFLGSSCIYPKDCAQPMREEYLLSGKLEPTNEGYALAKILGLKLCEYYNKQHKTDYICLMPCNLYGPNDHFELERSHVIPALITKFHDAKEKNKPFVEIWGTGKARREFLYVEDLVGAMIFFMNNYNSKDLMPFINIGLGEDISIIELAQKISRVIGYKGKIKLDTTKPDGMMNKLLDVERAKHLGWSAETELSLGLRETYQWFLLNRNKHEN